MSDLLTYSPSTYFDNTNGLLGNHFKFSIEALPDLTFFAQSVTIPSLSAAAIKRNTPFVTIHEAYDTVSIGTFDVQFMIDAQFRTYTSLLWWMRGLGFPQSYDEVAEFRKTRSERTMNVRPLVHELEKTTGLLLILQPDTEKPLVEVLYHDIFPVTLGEITFSTKDSDAPMLTCQSTFSCTDFDVRLL